MITDVNIIDDDLLLVRVIFWALLFSNDHFRFILCV